MSPQILSLIVFAENIHLNLNQPTEIVVCAPGFSICVGLIHGGGGLYSGGGLIFGGGGLYSGGAYIRGGGLYSEVYGIRERQPNLNAQTDSNQAKLFACFMLSYKQQRPLEIPNSRKLFWGGVTLSLSYFVSYSL